MDRLPEALVLDILSRLDDSTDVARCRVASKTFDTLSPDLRSVNLHWPLQKYFDLRSRASDSSSSSRLTSPLKTIFLNLISNIKILESVHISAENLPLDVSNADAEDYGNDMYITNGAFVKEWLPRVSESLKYLSVSDFWVQSSWRRSEILPLVSAYCHNLEKLEVKYAWLSVANLNPMPNLTTLTLGYIKLDDKHLTELNKCFPNLQVLNLIDVRGLKLPIIDLLNLKTCHWTSTGAPPFLTLITPNLITLRIECVKFAALCVKAPLLSHFHLSVDHVGAFSVSPFENLKSVSFKSSNILSLPAKFAYIKTIENVTLDSQDLAMAGVNSKFTLYKILSYFPTVTSLCFKSRVWSVLEVCYESFERVTWDGRIGLKTFRGYLLRADPSTFFSVACVLDQCLNLEDVSLLFHHDVEAHLRRIFIAWCMVRWQWRRVNWRWGVWAEGTKDTWIRWNK